MASVLRNNMKLCNLYRKSFYIRIPSHNCLQLQNRITRIQTGHVCLATAAHKPKFSDDTVNTKSSYEASKSDGTVVKTIDEALLNIDYSVRRTGRVAGKSVESIFSMIKEMGVPSKTHCLYLLRSCGKISDRSPSARVELANEIWKKYEELGLQFDTSHFNSLLKVYVENNHDFSPPEFLANMESQNADPTKNTYLYLIEKYCNDGNLSGANEVLEHMKEKNIPLNEQVFNSLIKGHVKLNDFSGAKKMLEVMRTSNLIPTAESYLTLACGYAEEGDLDGIESCLELGKSSNVSFSTSHYLQLILSAASAGHMDCMDKILEKIQDVSDYRQDFINVALELVHRNAADAAYKLITFSAPAQFHNGSNIFIGQLIKAGEPIGKIIQYCEDIHKKGFNDFIFISAAKVAIDHFMFDYALSLLEQAQQKGTPPRLHFFWSILSHYKDRNATEGVLSVLRKMYDLGIPADFISYTDYVLPAFENFSAQEIISKIQETGQSLPTAIDSLFQYYCMNGKINDALSLCENYEVRVSGNFPLKEYLYVPSGKNPISYLKVLKFIFEKAGLHGEDVEAIYGKFLAELISVNSTLLSPVLKQLEKKEATFSERSIDICRNLLRQKNPGLLVHLRKLEHSQPQFRRAMTVEEEDKHINTLKEQGASVKPFLYDRLMHHINIKDIDRACRIQTLIEEHGFILTPFSHMRLLRLFCTFNDLEKAKFQRKQLKEKHPTFKIDTILTLDYAALLIRFSKFEEVLELLKSECKEIAYVSNTDVLLRVLKQFFNIVVDTRDIEFVRNVQNALLSLKDFHPGLKNVLLEPLILAYLYRGEIESAIEEYRNCTKMYHVPIALNFLLRRCILADEQGKLQRVIDITSDCVGRNNALHELAVAFLETGQMHQALRVIQDLGSRADANYLLEFCKKLYKANKGSELEQLVSITRELKHVDRGIFYHYLIQYYVDRKDYTTCLKLWNHSKKENVELPEQTLEMLHHMQDKNEQSFTSTVERKSFAIENETATIIPSNQATEKFLEYLKKKDTKLALDELQRIKKGYIRSLTFKDMTNLIDLLLQEKHVTDLSSNVQAMSYIIENVDEITRPLLEKYSEAGDVETVMAIGNFLPDFSLKKISYNTFLCKAYITSGRQRDLLNELEKHYDKKNKLYSFIAFEELLKYPDLEERVNNLALKYLEVKYDTPISVVWAHNFVAENYDKADEICKLHPISVDKIESWVIRTIHQYDNIVMGRKFVDFLHNLNVRRRLKERAYGALLEVYIRKGMLDEAAALVVESEKYQVPLHDCCRSTLIALKSTLENEGKPVPFQIPSEDLNSGVILETEETIKQQ